VRDEGGTLLMAVADGVGGGPGGEIAAAAAIDTLAARFFAAPPDVTLEVRLAEAMRDANTAVLRAGEASGKPQAASTLVAAAVNGGRAVIGNLGDSRAYLVRGGAARQLTEDHAAGATHGITRFVGDPRGVQPDVFVEDLARGDRLVLCSDGLTRHVGDDEIAAALVGAMSALTRDPAPKPGSLDHAADTLVQLANSRGGEDNVTLVLYDADAREATGGSSRRAFALGVLTALVGFTLVGAIAILFILAPYAPGTTPQPSSSPSPSASASPSASPTPSESPSPSATP